MTRYGDSRPTDKKLVKFPWFGSSSTVQEPPKPLPLGSSLILTAISNCYVDCTPLPGGKSVYLQVEDADLGAHLCST